MFSVVRRIALAIWNEQRFLVRFWTAAAVLTPFALLIHWLA